MSTEPIYPTEEIPSYTWGSNEGMTAVLQKVKDSGVPYVLGLNSGDFETVFYVLREYLNTVEAVLYPEGEAVDSVDTKIVEQVSRVQSLLSGIAESVGVDWI
jgi:hypothetical protein